MAHVSLQPFVVPSVNNVMFSKQKPVMKGPCKEPVT